MLEYEPGDLTVIVEAGIAARALQARARRARPAALARSARRADARRVPARGPLRPAAPPLRHDARPRARRDGRARRRHARELGRQGRQERRRLRPRQALLRLARAARDASSGSRCGCTRCPAAARTVACRRARWRELHRSQLVPSAVDLVGRAAARAVRGLAARSVGRAAAQRSAARRPSRGTSCARCRPALPGRAALGRRGRAAGAAGPARRLPWTSASADVEPAGRARRWRRCATRS